MLMTLTGLFLRVMPVWGADPEVDALLRSPVGKDWVTNGGKLTNRRYSTLKQINTANVKQLKGAWMTRLKGSGFDDYFSFETSPLVKEVSSTRMSSRWMPRMGTSSGSTGPVSL
jgi:hypothetical protein